MNSLIVYASSSPENGEQVASHPDLILVWKILGEIPSLPVKKDLIAKQEKTLLFLTDLLKAQVNVRNLPPLVSFSTALQTRAEELSETATDEEEESALTRLGSAAAVFSSFATQWLRKHPSQTREGTEEQERGESALKEAGSGTEKEEDGRSYKLSQTESASVVG